jgi:hypothetical protein
MTRLRTNPLRSKPCRTNDGRQRRGIAVVLILGLLAVTLAVSYATLRGQGTTSQLAANNSRGLDAREAARSGLAAALQKISDTGWAGVGVPLSANVTPNSWYEVTFTTGDAKLTAGNPSYSEYPFRLTIESTGYAADPTNPAVRSIHKSRCVTQLVRTWMQPSPSTWTTLSNYTVHQWSSRSVYAQFPVRINGPTLLHGKLFLATEYPGTGANAPRDRYLEDLKKIQMPKALGGGGRPDSRPFSSPLTIALAQQDEATKTLLQSKLGLTLVNSTAATSDPLTHPGSVLTYRLYPGGKTYTPPILQAMYGNPIQNVTLEPNPISNPLGVFRTSGALTVQSNVRITGTIISDATGHDINVYGTNVVWEAANLPGLYGSSQVYQLPAVIARSDLIVNSAADMTIRGSAIVWDDFEIKRGSPSTKFELRGNLAASSLLLRGHSTWLQTPTTWNSDLAEFDPPGGLLGGIVGALEALLNNVRALLGLASDEPVFFPDYMHFKRGFVTQPILTFTPESSGVRSRWQDWTQPVYLKDPDDPGLRWEVIRWEHNP